MEFHEKIFHKDTEVFHAEAQRKRATVLNRGTLALTGYETALNRIVAVQERDATMLKKEQMQGA